MTAHERARARRLARPNAAVLGCLLVFAVFLLVAIGMPSSNTLREFGWAYWWLGYAFGGLAALLVIAIGTILTVQHASCMRGLLKTGNVEVLHCMATAAIALETIERSTDTAGERATGNGFAVQLTPTEIMFVAVRDCRTLVKNGMFPNRQFNLVRLPETHDFLALEPLGEPLAIAGMMTVTLPEDEADFPPSGYIGHGTLARIEEVLKAAAKDRSE